MEVCPICNGIYDIEIYCPCCGAQMQMLDRIENYEDNYSPYLDYEITDLNDGTAADICMHVAVCPNCGEKKLQHVKLVEC